MDRLSGMTIFLQAAETGSFSAAARVLKVSPGAVTKHVATLEDHLGVRLFDRTTRQVKLTEAGAILRARWLNIFDAIAQADEAVGSRRLKVQGTLRISSPAAFGRLVIAPLLAEYGKLHPAVVTELLFNNDHADPVADGIDVAFQMAGRAGPETSNRIIRRIGVYDAVVCAAPSYLSTFSRPRLIEDLAQHNCLGHRTKTAPGVAPWSFQTPNGPLSVAVGGSFLSNSSDAVVAAAVQGSGVICPPRAMVRDEIAAGRLVPLALDYPPTDVLVYACWASNRHLAAKVRTFIDFIVAHVGDPDPAGISLADSFASLAE